MVTVGTRLRIIRKDAGLSQVELGKLAGSNQSAINRYETDRAAVPYRMLIWYAQYFDVSMDYIFGLCDDKRGRIVTVSPEGAEEYVNEAIMREAVAIQMTWVGRLPSTMEMRRACADSQIRITGGHIPGEMRIRNC